PAAKNPLCNPANDTTDRRLTPAKRLISFGLRIIEDLNLSQTVPGSARAWHPGSRWHFISLTQAVSLRSVLRKRLLSDEARTNGLSQRFKPVRAAGQQSADHLQRD